MDTGVKKQNEVGGNLVLISLCLFLYYHDRSQGPILSSPSAVKPLRRDPEEPGQALELGWRWPLMVSFSTKSLIFDKCNDIGPFHCTFM